MKGTCNNTMDMKTYTFKQIPLNTLLVAGLLLVASCEVVELERRASGSLPNEATADVLDIGSQDLPADSAAFALLLHNGESKTWSADQFVFEGLSMFLACRLDDVMTLNADGTYAYDGGENLCGAEDDQRFRIGTWAFDVDTEQLTFDSGTSNAFSAEIVTLEEGIVVLESEYRSDIFGNFDIQGRYTVQ